MEQSKGVTFAQARTILKGLPTETSAHFNLILLSPPTIECRGCGDRVSLAAFRAQSDFSQHLWSHALELQDKARPRTKDVLEKRTW